jgi:hypothetical protein
MATMERCPKEADACRESAESANTALIPIRKINRKKAKKMLQSRQR